MTTKYNLLDEGLGIEHDSVEWMVYRLIDLAIEHGFNVNRSEYEIAIALLRANAVDEPAQEWLISTSNEALNYLNEECVYPGMMFIWDDGEVVLLPDFSYGESIAGTWFISDVQELYGVGLEEFETVIRQYGYGIEYVNDEKFRVVNNASVNA